VKRKRKKGYSFHVSHEKIIKNFKFREIKARKKPKGILMEVKQYEIVF
jgi:hypothetical protein